MSEFDKDERQAGVVFTIGNDGGLSVYFDESNPLSATLNHPVGFACLSIIIESGAPIRFFEHAKGDNGAYERDESSILSRLMQSPSKTMGRVEFFGLVMTQLALHGQAAILRVNPSRKTYKKQSQLFSARETELSESEEWHVLDVENLVNIYERGTGRKLGYRYGTGTEPVYYGLNDIIYIKQPWLSRNVQASPVAAAMGPMRAFLVQAAATRAIYENAGVPPGILSVEPIDPEFEITADAIKAMRADLENYMSGGASFGQIMVFGGIPARINYTSIQMDYSSLKSDQVKLDALREIHGAFRVSTYMTGLGDDPTYANKRESAKAFMLYTLIPGYIKPITSAIGHTFGTVVEADLENSPAMQDVRRENLQSYEIISYMTINEKRAADGLPPVENGDKIIISGGQLLDDVVDPVGDLGLGDPASGGAPKDDDSLAAALFLDEMKTAINGCGHGVSDDRHNGENVEFSDVKGRA